MIHASSGTHKPAEGLESDEAGQHHKALVVRLSAMMLFEFAVFGSWFATLGLVLATNKLPAIIGTAYSLGAVAAIVSPIFLGAIGDRFMASQKVLGLAHLAGAALMFFLPAAVKAEDGTLTLVLIFAYMIFFMPTLGLSNQIAFRNLGRNQRAFPYIRVFATVGWVVAGVTVGALGLSASTGVFTFAGVSSLLLGLYCFTLPNTPPAARGDKVSLGDFLGKKSFVLFRDRNFSVLIFCAFLTSISLGVYNSFAAPYLGALGIRNVAGVLAIGQASEVMFIIAVPFVLTRLGMKWALLLGMAMWGIRFILFGLAADHASWTAVLGVALHGICNDFFLVLSAMYIDRVAPVELKAQAQSWLIMAISGFGSGVGSLIAGSIFGAVIAPHMDAGPAAWAPMWYVPIGAAALTALVWTSLFRYSRDDHSLVVEHLKK